MKNYSFSFLVSMQVICCFLFALTSSAYANNDPFDWRSGITLCSGKTYDPCDYDLLAMVTATQDGLWNDTLTWDTGIVPTSLDDVVIPSGISVALNGTCSAKNITVNGILESNGDADFNLETEWLLVDGNTSELRIGTNTDSYEGEGIITLKGTNDGDNIAGMGDKFVGSANDGTINLHGKETISWTQLGVNASAGATQITLKEAVEWEVGDEIVIVSSRTDWNEAEQKTIIAISADQKTISLNSALAYPHTGVTKSYTRSTDGKTWTADLRAEVGLLSHNILIEGDSNSDSDGFGGHIMVHSNGKAYISGVELFRMGQKAILGRYPMHWHMLESAGSGQYFKNSSVHKSFNRALTIHGTYSTLVENNFFYDHIGHGVFLEDGSERFNIIRGNVTLLTKRPAPGEELTPSDNSHDQVQNRTPSSYWITNPRNTFENNIAAGTQGTGFWFAMPQRPMGASEFDLRFLFIQPYKEDLISFKGNVAHSCRSGFDIFDQLNSDHSIRANGVWQNANQHLIEDCTWYANDLAIYSGIGGGLAWANYLIFRNNVFVDNTTHSMQASYCNEEDCVFVAKSGENLQAGATYAHRVYDGAPRMKNCHFVGWNTSNANFLRNTGAAVKHPNHTFENITTDHAGLMNAELPDYNIPQQANTGANAREHPRMWSVVLKDKDGSLTGKVNTSMISNHPFLMTEGEFQAANWTNVYRTDREYVLARLHYNTSFSNYPNVTVTREENGCAAKESVHYMPVGSYKEWQQLPFIVNEDFEYTYQFETLPNPKLVRFEMNDAEVGDDFIARFKDFGKLGGLTISSPHQSVPSRSSFSDLKNNAASGYYKETNGDLYIKYVATQFQQRIDITWSTDFSVPMLDSDEDSISDANEINNGTDPFEYYTAPVCHAKLNIRIHLKGAYDASSMRTDIGSILPLTEPYSAMSSEVIENANVQTTTSIITNHEVVDWVKVQLRTTPTAIFVTRVGLLTKDGQIIDPETTNLLSFPTAVSGQPYYVVVQHRNHLGVMTEDAILLD